MVIFDAKMRRFHASTEDGKPLTSTTLMVGLETLMYPLQPETLHYDHCKHKGCTRGLQTFGHFCHAKTHCFHSCTRDGKPLTSITLMVGLEPLIYPLQPETLHIGHSKRNGCTRRLQTFGNFVLPKRIVVILAQEMANL